MAQIESENKVVLPPLPTTNSTAQSGQAGVKLPSIASSPAPAPAQVKGDALAAPAPVQLAPPQPVQIMTDKIGLNFTVKTFKSDGTSESITIPLPDSPDFTAWTFAQQVGMLKNGVWKDQSLQDIIFGLAYAKHIGAEVLEGELFPTGNGRWGTSNKYKIKKGFATGKILGYTTEIADLNKPLPDTIATKCVQKTELECTVTLEVKGLNKPIIRKAKLSRWWTGANPNWSSRPEHMLELNTLAHAMEYLVPGETDEAPPVPFDGLGYLAKEKEVTVEDLKRARLKPLPPLSPLPKVDVAPPVIEQGDALPDPTEIQGILDSVATDELLSK